MTDDEARATVDKCQDELTSLMLAWLDRGISPSDSAQIAAGLAHAMLATWGFSLKALVERMERQWLTSKGTP